MATASLPKDLRKIVSDLKKKDLSLREHQFSGLDTLWEWKKKGRCGILGDEMGLGKTCTAIIHMIRLHMEGGGPFIVFSPFSVVEHWKDEIGRFASGKLQAYMSVGSESERLELFQELANKDANDRKNAVLIIAHPHAEKSCLQNKFFGLLQKCGFSLAVVDEAQRAKNREARLHHLLRKLQMKSQYLLLTGTPIQNDLYELHSLLTLIDSKRFPYNKGDAFVEEYSDKLDVLSDILGEYFLRRTKEVVCKDLPPIEQVVFYHGMSAKQLKLYSDILHVDHSVVSAKSYNSLINLLMQMRKVVAHPYLFRGQEPEPFTEGEHLVEASGKLIVLDRLIKFLLRRNHSCLIFSQFTIFLDILQDFLDLRGLEYSRLDGRMDRDERNVEVDKFQSSNKKNRPRLFLLSTRAGGLGLNLVNADTVIFTDSDWNPQVDLQAMARCHRIGQTKPVRVIRLIGRYTVEQVIHARARGKLHLTEKLIGVEMDSPKAYSLMAEVKAKEVTLQRRGKLSDEHLSDEAIEKIVGKTDSKGQWMPVDNDKELGEDVEVLEDVDTVDHKDVDVEDYKKFQGRDYRVADKDRDELRMRMMSTIYNGTRSNNKTDKSGILDRDEELDILLDMKARREKGEKRRSGSLLLDLASIRDNKVAKREVEENDDDMNEITIMGVVVKEQDGENDGLEKEVQVVE